MVLNSASSDMSKPKHTAGWVRLVASQYRGRSRRTGVIELEKGDQRQQQEVR
jgi:hypothetical protein